MATSVALGHQVDGFRGAAHEDDLALVAGVHKLLHSAPRRFMLFGGVLRKIVNTAMDIGIAALVIMRDSVNDRARLLRSCCVVEIHERMSVDLLLQDRKIAAYRFHVEVALCHRRTRLPANAACGRCHPTSSQFLPRSSAATSAAVRTFAIANRWRLINSSMWPRTDSSFMRSRHSLAKASKRSLRADDSSMPRERR